LVGQLGEQAFLERLAPDAGGIKGLQDGEGLLHGLEGQLGLQRGIGRRLGQEAAVIEAADQVLDGVAHGRGQGRPSRPAA
jgi:hypothetical protein